MAQIPPVIGTQAGAAAYSGLTVAALAANIFSGITMGTYINTLLGVSAQKIVAYLDYDFTLNQVHELSWQGNDHNYIDIRFPFGSANTFKSFNPSTLVMTSIGGGVLVAADTGNPWRVYRNDNNSFDAGLSYSAEVLQGADPRYGNGWPEDVKQAQYEFVQIIIKESQNSGGLINIDEMTSPIGGMKTKFKEVESKLFQRIRPYKKFSI